MDPDAYNDFVWLTSESATEYLETALRLFEKNLNPLKIAKLLRKSISPQRAALAMEQAQLRIRGRRKFESADEMFFTGRSLEQSTSSLLATYKAKRFRDSSRVADICCGIGGDLISLAKRTDSPDFETVGVEQDPVPAQFARANLKACDAKFAKVETVSFEDFDLEPFDAVHVDPDRRVKGRTTTADFFEPSLQSVFDRVSLDRQRVAIKVAPATEIEDFDFPVEREWIGEWRECKQQVLWAGPGIEEDAKVATVVARDGARCHFRSVGAAQKTLPPTRYAETIGPYIYEPHASVLAGGLGDELAGKYSLEFLSRGIAYMNSEQPLEGVEPILKGYRVDDVLPVDLKQIQKKLKSLDAGSLIIKKRGVDQVLADNVGRLKLGGDQKITIILTRHQKSRRAILVTRMVGPI
ncbi:class I SAM-dependent methyltransferase [Mariniblastus fucicola]|uniref:THUMP-like domain-containing protein n=1 Tax=Mariniblastus fucicola TaxID=980251 RepID=A0A5B9PAQ0_9BACT|nr:class I SAM-dependent methyltransferase [Mariniblastus fucicola]QEG23448.1 hypothetical protein MFFC18_33470 [Mariniblastus fucicola]